LDKHTLAKHITVTEDRLQQIASDQYDAIQIISRCPECFRAYRDLIHKKRCAPKAQHDIANPQEGGLTADNSQQGEGCLIGPECLARFKVNIKENEMSDTNQTRQNQYDYIQRSFT
jgi:hypothetical protein